MPSSVPGPIALISDSFDRACAEGAVRGAALAGTEILGALAETNLLDGDHNHYVFSRARAETKFLISGPDGMVSTSINLWLDSSSASDAGGIRLLRVRAFPFGTGVIVIRPPDLQDGEGPGDVVEHGGTMFLPDLNCGPCELTSVELMLPTNTELDFTLELVAIAERRTGTNLQRDLDRRRRHAEQRPPLDLGMELRAMIASVPLFTNLDQDGIVQLSTMLRPRLAMPGEPIIARGGRGTAMYFIAAGAVDVVLGIGVIRLESGNFFGEIALLSDQRRNADVVAVGYCHLLVLQRSELRRLLRARAGLRAEIERVAAARLAEAPPAATQADPGR